MPEPNTPLREVVDVGRFHPGPGLGVAAERFGVLVIGEDKEDVGPVCSRDRQRTEDNEGNEEEQ
jgi:hypothetical protein